MLVLGTDKDIAVLLDCSKSSRQCSLPYLLTYRRSGNPGNPSKFASNFNVAYECDQLEPVSVPPTGSSWEMTRTSVSAKTTRITSRDVALCRKVGARRS